MSFGYVNAKTPQSVTIFAAENAYADAHISVPHRRNYWSPTSKLAWSIMTTVRPSPLGHMPTSCATPKVSNTLP
jgi:hypothetical protein